MPDWQSSAYAFSQHTQTTEFLAIGCKESECHKEIVSENVIWKLNYNIVWGKDCSFCMCSVTEVLIICKVTWCVI